MTPNARMARIAVIEDDLPTSNQLAGWIASAKSGIVIDQWFTRDDAEAALAREHYDAVVLDIELGRERHAGVALINAINKLGQGTPVLVVSAMPAAIYRSIMKALDAWDYLQKTTFEEADFIETFLDILRTTQTTPAQAAPAAAPGDALVLDPLWQRTPPGAASASTCRSPRSASWPRCTSAAARSCRTTSCSMWSRAAATATTCASM